jgi:hypothetical protein
LRTKAESNVVKIKKTNPVLNLLTFLLLAVAIVVMAFAVYLKSIGYSFSTLSLNDAITYVKSSQRAEKTASSGISFSQDGSVDCKLYREFTILLSKDGIKWYDRKGKLIQEKALSLASPALRCSDRYMAVVDISGRDVFFYKDKKMLWSRRLDNKIVNASVSDEGYCTVVTQSTEYKASVNVIDINGVDKYIKRCAEDIVMSAKSIHNGQDILINKVVTDSVKTGTQLEFDNIYQEKPFATVNIPDGIMPVVISHGKNELAVGQNLMIYMDEQGKEVWRKGADSIYCVAPDSDKYIIAAGKFTNAAGVAKQQVLVLNEKGEEVYSFDQPENISGMDYKDGSLILRTQRSIYLYTIKGKKLGQYSARNEIRDAYLVSSNDVVIISGGEISLVKI